MVGYGIYGLGTAVAGVVFACGVLFQKVNHHGKWIKDIDDKVDKHSEAVSSIDTSIGDMKGDIVEIKKDVKTLLRNGSKK